MRSATKEERLYARRQSSQLVCETGCRGFAVINAAGVKWRDEYKQAGDIDVELIDDMCADARDPRVYDAYPDCDGVLRNDVGIWAIILRREPASVYVYRKDWLDAHIEDAKRGIRFIDPHYRDLFRVEDGEHVEVHQYDDFYTLSEARYIDPTHLELDGDLFHICELAEYCQKAGITLCKHS